MKSLVIVESPAKAKTINKILGKEFSVKASVGHVRDLPEKELGVEVEKGFEPKYIVIPGKEKVIRELKRAAKSAEVVYLAPDPDREGEAIAWHIAEVINDSKGKGGSSNGKKLYRITFNEITERAVREAIKNPGQIDMNKVLAQQARRILDRLVGYELSPLLWRKVRRGLSAGRVQSVALRLVVEREKEIQAFKPVDYWSITGEFLGDVPPQFRARLFKFKNRHVINREKGQFLLRSEEDAKELLESLRNRQYYLASVEKKLRRRNPPAPFITSTLQQEASRKLRFTPKKTMMLAQQLYEGIELGEEGSVGLITYMRTDSTRVAEEAVEAAREYIKEKYGKEYLPSGSKRTKKTQKKIQDAHEAIRPTYLSRPPESVKKFLSRDQYALYRLIWQRFIASQMAAAKIEQTTFVIHDREDEAEFRVSGDVVKFKGFMAVYTEGKDEPESEETEGLLPDLKEGTTVSLQSIEYNAHQTQPPPRYSEATLVKALEEKGIGRPSTYATILSVIQDRKYVRKKDGRLVPTELGILVSDLLVERFPELMDVQFTARMEDELDKVEGGEMQWVKVVEDFYRPFKKDLQEAMETLGRVKPKDEPTDIVCELCGQPMVKRWGRHGRFLACSGYPKCKNTRPLEGEENKAQPETTDEKCPECGAQMVIRTSRYGRFLACSRYPECKGTKPLSTGVKCPLDGGDIVERRSKKGKVFWSCSNWPQCKFASWYKPVNQKCPECGSEYMVERRDRQGNSYLLCPNKECKHKEPLKTEDTIEAKTE